MNRSRLKNKANKNGKPADKTAYKTLRNSVIKLNKEANKSFLKNQITENATNKTKNFGKLGKPFFTEKGFNYKQKFTLKTKRGVTLSETAIANIFNNYFRNNHILPRETYQTIMELNKNKTSGHIPKNSKDYCTRYIRSSDRLYN